MNSTPANIGRYTILERLAMGGMAQVYLGYEEGQSALNRLVVIKQILPQYAEDESFRRMFQQEARLAANINHPNIVEIHELGEWEGQPFLAMEYVSGVPLNVLMRRVREKGEHVPIGVALGIIAQACAGAQAAHDLLDPVGAPANLVHRDLTPHNLIIAESGHVKILDFGVAKASTNQDKTETGMLKGKLPYMSPEQLWQSEVDRRSDVFTLGVVLWELLIGEKLFAREQEVATINAVLNSTLPDIKSIRPDVPPGVLQAALGALEKNLAQRTPSAEGFRAELMDAARTSMLDCSEEAIKAFVDGHLGPSLTARRQEVAAQVERSINRMPGDPAEETTVITSAGTTGAPVGTKRGVLIGAIGALVVAGAIVVGLMSAGILDQGRDDLELTPAPDDTVVILLAPTVGPEILRQDLEPLRRYLQRELGTAVDWRFADSYGSTSDALIKGDVDFASLPPAIYVQTKAADDRVQLVASKVHSGTSYSDAILLVREGELIDTAADLRGKRICYPDTNSTTGYFLPRTWLREQGVNPDTDLKAPPVISGNHHNLIRDVIDGRCDLGGSFMAAYKSAEEAGVNSAVARVFGITGRTPHDSIIAGPLADPEVVNAMRNALLEFDPQREAGQKFLGSVERLTGFADVGDKVYDRVRDALDAERKAQLADGD